MSKNESGKIIQFEKDKNINKGNLFFVVIFIYIIICIFMYFTTEHISRYQVKVGSLTESNIYQGIALRDEVVVNSEYAGYVNYYCREGERAGFNDLVCSIDESGELQELLVEEATDGNTLSDIELSEVRSQIVSFISNTTDDNFSRVYDFKYDIEGTVLKLSNLNILENLESLNSSIDSGMINLCRTSTSGIIIYAVDGYEEYTPSMITTTNFDTDYYEKTSLISNSLVNVGDPIYKLSTDENWSIVIETDSEQAQRLLEEVYIKVRFLKNQNESWAEVNVLSDENDVALVELMFNNSMITFATERFLDIELIFEEKTGLKVPNSAIEEKKFFLIPEDFITTSTDGTGSAVLLLTYDEDGNKLPVYIDITVYNIEDGNYYVDESMLNLGDTILKSDNLETFTIAQSDSLTGVYNVNKGYAEFKRIQVLYSNEEYSIIQSNSTYGLRAYDYIVLDAATINMDDLVIE
ncbi:MAG: HlyD family efflux transporter periplasmic adaptor subunit [Eubacteriales bacterium]